MLHLHNELLNKEGKLSQPLKDEFSCGCGELYRGGYPHQETAVGL